MLLTLLKSKLHRATVTAADLEYEGSVGIDADLLDLAGILPHERVEIYDITNGARLATYAIALPAGTRAVQINGAAAHLVNVGDRVIICAYAQMEEAAARVFSPTVVLLGEDGGPNTAIALNTSSGSAPLGGRMSGAG